MEKVLSRFGFSDRDPAPTPYDFSILLRKKSENCKRSIDILQTIGSLMYLTSATRPDISYAVCKLS